MQIAIFGVGGVGGYFGGRLAQSGAEVIFIARGAHLQGMQQAGLRVDSVQGNFRLESVQATADPASVGPVDVVLVAVKAWQVTEAANAIRPLVGPQTMVVPLQNGVEAPAQLGAVLGQDRVLGGFCRIVSYIEGPGHIHQAGGDATLAFGELDNQRSERVERLYHTIRQADGLQVDVPSDIQAAMWGKFLSISAWSGIGAVTRVPVGDWRSLPETRQLWQTALREVQAVAQAHGIVLPADIIERTTRYVDNLSPTATASMQRDIMAARPSELESLSGAVVRLGQEVGVETPVHHFIYHTLRPQELGVRQNL